MLSGIMLTGIVLSGIVPTVMAPSKGLIKQFWYRVLFRFSVVAIVLMLETKAWKQKHVACICPLYNIDRSHIPFYNNKLERLTPENI